MCALDALGVAFMLGAPTRVTSADPASDEPINVSVDRGGEATWSPEDAVVVVGCDGDGSSAACICPHTNFAASEPRGRALLEAIPGSEGTVLAMPAAVDAGRELFGDLLASANEEDTDVAPDRTH
jgi:hypothetical protein